jgi:hypothetical protein
MLSSTPIACEENYRFFDPLIRLGIDPLANLDFNTRSMAIPYDRTSPVYDLLFSKELSAQHNDIWRLYLDNIMLTAGKKSRFHLFVKKARELNAIEKLMARCASHAAQTGDDDFLAKCIPSSE